MRGAGGTCGAKLADAVHHARTHTCILRAASLLLALHAAAAGAARPALVVVVIVGLPAGGHVHLECVWALGGRMAGRWGGWAVGRADGVVGGKGV